MKRKLVLTDKDAYITGLRDAFEIFNCNLSHPAYHYPSTTEKYLSASKQIVEKNLLSNELWR